MENIPCDPDIKKWVSGSIEQLFTSLKTSSTGLTNVEVEQRLQQNGYNILPEKKET